MNRFWKYGFPPIYGLLIYFTVRLVLDTVTGMRFWHRDWGLNCLEMATCILASYALLYAFRRLFRYFDRRWQHDFSYGRIARELWYVFLVNQLLVNAIVTPVVASTDDGLQWYDLVDINTIPLMFALIYYGVVRSSHFLKAYVDSRLQLEKIANDTLQAELKFLKAQYHPHFLFNALNTIYFQMDEDVAGAKKSVEKFSELLRYQLYDQQQTVPVSQEIRYLESFIQLQQMRSSEKLRLNVQFDGTLNEQQVYPLLFLPLVENAFKYVGGDYWIRIEALAEGPELRFTVDNALPADPPPQRPGGIGLDNLKRRLALLYPGKHLFHTERQGGRFVARLTLNLQN
ncbi:MAG: histidine kinase [Bacteroidota bacterium]|nr:histidine kinase [Bacteroidota bacterium]MDP4218683.1 histidine kinase [Bacteroidota bacterium]MDP4247571.1 histidine kinase [Bacteroidota bacterium]MDP4255562.1 histidine kinase [Bacteroidota bacterium]MDP4259682.1 histidine kinase [Bacteroidota bacterium]